MFLVFSILITRAGNGGTALQFYKYGEWVKTVFSKLKVGAGLLFGVGVERIPTIYHFNFSF